MGKTKIEWTEYSWNPVSGCTPASEGCQNCYAKRMANRLRGRCGYPQDDPFRVTLHEDRLGEPLRWKQPRRVFVCSMGDLFHEDVKDEWIARIWWVMGQCAGYLDPSRYRGHTFIILTKRPERMQKWLNGWNDGETRRQWIESFGEVYDWMSGPKYWPDVLPNVWLGVTAENQRRADERIPILLQIPAAVRFVSVEPMLGPVDLSLSDGVDLSMSVGTGLKPGKSYLINSLDWVICGGETGPNARSMHPDWVRSLRDQCVEAGVPFFFKQWGEWLPDDQVKEPLIVKMGHPGAPKWAINKLVCNLSPGLHAFKVGKKAAGRLLDGREWNEYPIEESLGPICDVGDPYPRGGNHPTENMHFIAMAREALPYWIERAVAAEKKIAELIADLYERDLALQVESEALGNAEAWADKLEKALEQTFKRRGMEEFVACWKEYFLEGDSDA